MPSAAGSHDFKFGWDYLIDGRNRFQNHSGITGRHCSPDCDSGPIRYLDNSSFGRPHNVDRILITSAPTLGRNRNEHWDFFAQDIWSPTDRLTLTLGVRIGMQDLYYTDAERTPDLPEFFSTEPVEGNHYRSWKNVAPRTGLTFDPTGNGRTIFKAYYGRYYEYAATQDGANPGGLVQLTYEFLDPNENGLYDGPDELGRLLTSSGGTVVQFDPAWEPAYVDELSFSFEQELAPDLGTRVTYVRKQRRNDWDQYNVAQALNLTEPVTEVCTGCPGEFEGMPLNLLTVPDELAFAVDNVFAQTPGDTGMDYDTLQFAVTRRFRSGFFLQGNFDYQWRDELRDASGDSQSPLVTDPIDVDFFINHSLDVPNKQKNTNWQGKVLARYVFPRDVGIGVNLRHQSGFPWAPIHRLRVPNVGTRAIFLEPIENNRSENVTLLDLRIDKAFTLGGSHTISAMADVTNLLNSNAENNFVLRTGGNFRDIIEWLPGRTLKLGLRYIF